MRLALTTVALLVASSAPAQTVPAEACPALKNLALPGATVTLAQLSPAGAAIPGVALPKAIAASLPVFCRVRLVDRPSDDSEILTEVWLPVAWNGSLRGQGNGGFAGFIDYASLATAVQQGFASAGTDTGHTGGTADFALHHPEKIKDFGWRAVHEMTVEARLLAAAFYGKPPAHAYFTSCSDGGREALMEAERFPADYDGILAGAPAWNWTGLVSTATATRQRFSEPGAALPAGKVPVIDAAVRRACDQLDGVADGVLNDPRACHFDPTTLQCKAADGPDCLTAPQVATLRRLYTATVDASGRQVMPPLLPGAEAGGNGWAEWITGTPQRESLASFFGRGFFANFVYDRADWKVSEFSLDRDLKLARSKVGGDLDANDPNLKPFTSRGGKLILYHGWNDPAIPALSTIEFYSKARASLGDAATENAIRLYMVPGMKHCAGGPGATSFAQNGTDARGDPEHDVFAALERWVEAGKAPGTITATHDKDGNPAKGVEFTRPLCPYPAHAGYVGGDTSNAASFVCQSDGKGHPLATVIR